MCSSPSMTSTLTSTWGRARRSTRSTTTMPTISTMAAQASSAARKSRSAPAISTAPPPTVPSWGAAYRDFLAQYYTRHAAVVAQTEVLPYPDQTIDLDPEVRDAWGLPAPRLTYDWRRPNELACIAFMQIKMQEIGRAMDASLIWRA